MQKVSKILSIAIILSITALQAGVSVSGTVTSDNGEPLAYANVTVVGTNVGTASSEDGSYTLDLPSNFTAGQSVTLTAGYIGYKSSEAELALSASGNTQNFSLETDVIGAEAVIVTALGISKAKKALGYSVQDVQSDELNMVEQDNVVNALSGKVAGVQVLSSAGGSLGGSAKIRLRGANGMSDTQPLWVVDGTPLDNTSFSDAYSGRDYGNMANDVNMDDIASISVLKGASASALYGSRAANGVILITTKKGTAKKKGMGLTYSLSTGTEDLLILPEYQNEYAGGYSQDWATAVDPEDGQEYNILNYAADESWGPKIDGTTMYRPWWSWIHHDFDGDGVDDYGTEIALEAQPNNVKDFFDQAASTTHSVTLDGGSDNSSYRLSVKSNNANGIIPNSSLEKSNVGFSGSLNLTSKVTSSLNLNYANTQGNGRPASGYSPSQGNPLQSFNQWFQRQLNIDYLREYRGDDGSIYSWNLRSTSDQRPLYWDSPFFTLYENVSEDERNRLFGNFTTKYQLNENLSFDGTVRTDMYDFVIEDRIGSGGLETDAYSMEKITLREMNYEGRATYQTGFSSFNVRGILGGNYMEKNTSNSYSATSGGLSLPGFYNLDASIDRPDVSTGTSNRAINSVFGQLALDYGGWLYTDFSLRNDVSSTLPTNANSYTYYSLSNSLVFSELFSIPGISFGKIRASMAQVGNDTDPYSVALTYSTGTPYGSSASLAVPDILPNPDLKPAISTDTEFGLELSMLDNRLRFDAASYTSVKEDEIIDLSVPGASGYTTTLVNAGKFTTTGTEFQVSATPISTEDMSLDFAFNWAASESKVNKLAEGMDARSLFRAYWGTYLYANVGEEWGIIQGTGYKRYPGDDFVDQNGNGLWDFIDENGNGVYDFIDENDNGVLDDNERYEVYENWTDLNGNGAYDGPTNDRLVNTATGNFEYENNMEFGSVLPDYTGGFRVDLRYKNLDIGAFFDFQKGGQFYSLTRQWGLYSGMTDNTIGDNSIGNPLRDPVMNAAGDTLDFVALSDAGSNSGGVLIEGVDSAGTAVSYLLDAVTWAANSYYKRSEENLVDGSYLRFREFRVGYNVPSSLLEGFPIVGANLGFSIRNVAMLSSAEKGIDPTTASNGHGDGFSYWEGGVLPSTRAVSVNLKLTF